MKRLALGLLLAMLVLTAACAWWQRELPWLAWVRAFSEAAAVGALADWFAVTALFRHPLGLPIPHTAIIPRNKDAIGRSLGDFVERNFLTPEHVVRRVEGLHPARTAAAWLLEPGQRERLVRTSCAAAAWVLARLDDREARRFIEDLVAAQLRRADAARLGGELLDLLAARATHQALFDGALRGLDGWLGGQRDLVRQKVRESSKLTPGFVDNWISDRFVDGMLALLHDAAQDPQHDLRVRFDLAVRDTAHALRHSPRWRRRGQALARWLAASVRQGGCGERIWAEARERLAADLRSPGSVLGAELDSALAGLAEALGADAAMQRKVDQWLLELLEVLLLRHRHHVGRLIAEVVRSWDAVEVSRKVEAEIGRDLQFIRINGTVVGGLAGLALHAMAFAL